MCKTLDLYYYSFTGTCKEIASELGQFLGIIPKTIESHNFPYWTWLLLSFFPKVSTKISYPPPESREAILVFPKWTFNCPPVTAFLKKVNFERLFLIISYGGWGEKPYGERYKNLALQRSTYLALHLVRRSDWHRNKKNQLEKIKEKLLAFFNLPHIREI